MSNFNVSLLRTSVPALWGTLLGWLLVHVPWLPHTLILALRSQQNLVTTGSIIVWYAVWRWLEKRLPKRLARLVLGSSKSPIYAALVTTLAHNFSSPIVPGMTVTTSSGPSVVGEKGPEIVNLPANTAILPTQKNA